MKEYLIDTHAHVDMLEESIKETFAKMQEFQVKKIVIPSVELPTIDKILEIANKYENIYAMLGIFPSEVKTYTDEIEEKFKKLAENNKIVAIGEIGLDYYWDKSFCDLQQEVFIKQIKLANFLGLPVVIHDREAHKDTLDILKEQKMKNVLLHCFSGSVEFMKECTASGYKIALGGVVTFKNAITPKEVAKEVEPDDFMLETDCPYLTPHPFRGLENSPKYIGFSAKEIARIKNIPYDEIIDITSRNAKKFFGLEEIN